MTKKKRSTDLATQGHDATSCPDIPKFNLAVLKDTVTADQAADMSEAELHDGLGMTLARGVAAYRSFCNIMTEVKKRLNDEKEVGGCTTLKAYVEKWVMLPNGSFDAAIRKVYRAIADTEKNPARTGRPPRTKSAQDIAEEEEAQRRRDARAESSRRSQEAMASAQPISPAIPVEVVPVNLVAAKTARDFDEAVRIIHNLIFNVDRKLFKKVHFKEAVSFLKAHNAFSIDPPPQKPTKAPLTREAKKTAMPAGAPSGSPKSQRSDKNAFVDILFVPKRKPDPPLTEKRVEVQS